MEVDAPGALLHHQRALGRPRIGPGQPPYVHIQRGALAALHIHFDQAGHIVQRVGEGLAAHGAAARAHLHMVPAQGGVGGSRITAVVDVHQAGGVEQVMDVGRRHRHRLEQLGRDGHARQRGAPGAAQGVGGQGARHRLQVQVVHTGLELTVTHLALQLQRGHAPVLPAPLQGAILQLQGNQVAARLDVLELEGGLVRDGAIAAPRQFHHHLAVAAQVERGQFGHLQHGRGGAQNASVHRQFRQLHPGGPQLARALLLEHQRHRAQQVGHPVRLQPEHARRIVHRQHLHLADLQQMPDGRDAHATGAGPVLNLQHATLHHQRGDGVVGIARPGDQVFQVPRPGAPAHQPQARLLQFHLADGQLAINELFLVVVQHRPGHIGEVGFVEVVAAGHAQPHQRDAAQQAHRGPLQRGGDARHPVHQRADHGLTQLGRIRPRPKGGRDRQHQAGAAEDQSPHHPGTPGGMSPFAHATLAPPDRSPTLRADLSRPGPAQTGWLPRRGR